VRPSRTSRIWSRRRLEQPTNPPCFALTQRYIPKSSAGSDWAIGWSIGRRRYVTFLLAGCFTCFGGVVNIEVYQSNKSYESLFSSLWSRIHPKCFHLFIQSTRIVVCFFFSRAMKRSVYWCAFLLLFHMCFAPCSRTLGTPLMNSWPGEAVNSGVSKLFPTRALGVSRLKRSGDPRWDLISEETSTRSMLFPRVLASPLIEMMVVV